MNDASPPPFTLQEAFREAFRQHPSGVVVIAADPGDGPVALTLSSLISVSASPPTVAFSLSNASTSAAGVRRAGSMVIHFPRLRDVALAQLCATSGADRFGPSVNWTRLPTGEPRYTDIDIWFRARIIHQLSVTGATLIVAELVEGSVPAAGDATDHLSMVYLNRRWHGLSPIPDQTT
jgi:flavin reductase (DIM6/NTAB) family NADH-FMN oxidoreductase RutF